MGVGTRCWHVKEQVWGWGTGGMQHGHSTGKYADGVKEDGQRQTRHKRNLPSNWA